MDIARKLGILVVFAVPAIVGGGIVFAWSGHSYPAVAAFEVLLLLAAGAFAAR